MNKIYTFLLGSLLCSFWACTPVKSYQKMYLNDSDMALSNRDCAQFESNAETYREGSSGANGGKVGGGCGCN